MDTPFSVMRWNPSKPYEVWETLPSHLTVATWIETLNSQTAEIAAHPYDPTCWLYRAKTLVNLRYPELAVGDACKVIMLCENMLGALVEGRRCNLGCRAAFFMMEDDCDDKDEKEHDRASQRMTLAGLQTQARKLMQENLDSSVRSKEERVIAIARPYPWLREKHLMRSDKVIGRVNKAFLNAAWASGNMPCCTVERFAFGRGVGARNGEDLLGVFATRDIRKGERLVQEENRIWGCNGSNGREDLPANLRWIRKQVGKFAANTILRCRLLICAVTDGARHPLDHHLIARLTPMYRPDIYERFDLQKDIAVMNQVLQQHGVDIFADVNWDTYIFFAIKARLSNNSWSTPTSESISSLFSFFNHSCEANVEWKSSNNLRTMIVSARRDIARGEQLFVCYDGFAADQPLEARRSRFWKWINGPCQCSKCLREEDELRCSVDSSPTKSAASEASRPSPAASWDTEIKPILPEDGLVLENDMVEPID